MARESSRGNELPNAFLERQRDRRLIPFNKNIMQGGQHFCYSFLDKLLQDGGDAWCKFLT